jgi:hypothetical protein
MRFYLGHRLPLGFYGGIGIGSYGRRPTHVLHEDGSRTPLRSTSAVWFWVGVLVFVLWLVLR